MNIKCKAMYRLIACAAILFQFSMIVPVANSAEMGTPEEAQDMVARAIELYKQVGAEAAFDKFTNNPEPEFLYKDLYLYVIHDDHYVAAHSYLPHRVGDPTNLGTLDADGKNINDEVLSVATPEGGLASYRFKNPSTGVVEKKTVWVVWYDKHIFGVGHHN